MEEFSISEFVFLLLCAPLWLWILSPAFMSKKALFRLGIVTWGLAISAIFVFPQFPVFDYEMPVYPTSAAFCILFTTLIYMLWGRRIAAQRGEVFKDGQFAWLTLFLCAVVLIVCFVMDVTEARFTAALYLIPVVLSFILAEVLRRILARRSKLALWWANGISLLVLEAAAAVWFLAQPYYLLVMFALFQGTLLELSYGGYLAAKKMAGVAK